MIKDEMLNKHISNYVLDRQKMVTISAFTKISRFNTFATIRVFYRNHLTKKVVASYELNLSNTTKMKMRLNRSDTLTFMTSLSRVLLSAAPFFFGKNCSSLKIDKIRKASSEVISSLPCCPKVWKKRNHLSKTQVLPKL